MAPCVGIYPICVSSMKDKHNQIFKHSHDLSHILFFPRCDTKSSTKLLEAGHPVMTQHQPDCQWTGSNYLNNLKAKLLSIKIWLTQFKGRSPSQLTANTEFIRQNIPTNRYFLSIWQVDCINLNTFYSI